MKKILFGLMAAGLLVSGAQAQTVVFSDTFSNLTQWTTVASGDGGASSTGGVAVLTNDATAAANSSGRTYIRAATSGFGAPWNSVLQSNTGLVSWSFNMQQIRADPSGFDSGNYGVGFVLAGTNTDFTLGDGYAVVLGNSGSTDPIRLVRYSGGIDLNSNITNLISASSPLNDVGSNYLSLRVTYNPADNTWSLFGRDDGVSAFTDPLTGSLTSLGSVVNNTFTGSTMVATGAVWNYSTAASQTSQIDNYVVSVVPEPSAFVLAALGMGALYLLRRRSK